MGTLYFGKQWLTKGNTCCTGGSPPSEPARGFRLVSTGGGGGGLLTFGKTVKRGSSYECLCGLISVPFTFTVHFDPVGIAPNEGGACLLYENQRQDETLTIRYELEYASNTGDIGYFRFRVSNYDNDLGQDVSTTIRTDSGYHLLGGALQITCTYTAPPLLNVDRSLYMAIYINGLRADTSIIDNDGLSSSFASWPQPSGGMNIYNSCQYDDEEPDNMQIGIVTEWNRGFTPNEAQEFFNNSINKQQNVSMWAAMFQEPPEPGPPFGYLGNYHQRHDTGQTTNSISHDTPLNEWTTTKGIGLRRKWIIGAALATFPEPTPPAELCGNYIATNYIASSETINTTWTAPPGVTKIVVECQGPGANGDNGANSIVDGWPGGSGGGSGGYAKSTLTVIPGNTYNIIIGGGGSELDTSFDGIVVGNTGGPGSIGGTANFGDFTIDGTDGNPGEGWNPPFTNSNGGDGADSPTGGDGGGLGLGSDSLGGGGGVGGLGAGGGGGGGGADAGGPGGIGGPGWMRISIPGFGNNHIAHQTHSTGQTSVTISHCAALNDWTTTKGISMRRKYIFGSGLTPASLPPGLSLPCGPTNQLEED